MHAESSCWAWHVSPVFSLETLNVVQYRNFLYFHDAAALQAFVCNYLFLLLISRLSTLRHCYSLQRLNLKLWIFTGKPKKRSTLHTMRQPGALVQNHAKAAKSPHMCGAHALKGPWRPYLQWIWGLCASRSIALSKTILAVRGDFPFGELSSQNGPWKPPSPSLTQP